MKWKDERYVNGSIATPLEDICNKCDNNKKRVTTCPTKYVTWTEKNQFWFPRLHVLGSLELVFSPTNIS